MVDFGVGNLMSVLQAVEYCGISAISTSNPDVLQKTDKIILPGVGAFPNAMRQLNCLGLVEPLREMARRGKPLLGICLGMQLLLEKSEEFEKTEGLAIIPGEVVPIPTKTLDKSPLKVPSIGWSRLIPSEKNLWDQSLLGKISDDDEVYFVHSFMAIPRNPGTCLANYVYGGHKIVAVIRQNNIVGCQFHPEKSGVPGLKIINEFLNS